MCAGQELDVEDWCWWRRWIHGGTLAEAAETAKSPWFNDEDALIDVHLNCSSMRFGPVKKRRLIQSPIVACGGPGEGAEFARLVALVAALLFATTHASMAIFCSLVNSDVGPCLTFGCVGAGPSMVCCRGIKNLYAAACNTGVFRDNKVVLAMIGGGDTDKLQVTELHEDQSRSRSLSSFLAPSLC